MTEKKFGNPNAPTTTIRNPGSFPFQEAVRRRAKLRIALDGPSGSGKTHSALLLAAGLVGNEPLREDGTKRIAVIDTEKSSASLEAGKPGIPPFDTAPLGPPYTPRRYIELIKIAQQHYDVLIIDSLSHAWSAEGGVLDMADKAKASQRNKFAAWREVTPYHNALVESILQSDCHIIACIRTKTAWDFEENEKGKKVPIKVGMKPEQREGIEYEFTLVLDLAIEEHIATPSKDRTSLFMTQTHKRREKLAPEHGQELIGWMDSGADPLPPPPPAEPQKKNGNGKRRLAELYRIAKEGGITDDGWKLLLKDCGIQRDPNTWTPAQLNSLNKRILERIEELERGEEVPFDDPILPVDDHIESRPEGSVDSIDHDTRPLEDHGKRKISGDQIDHLLETAKIANPDLHSAKRVLQFAKFILKDSDIRRLEDLTFDQLEGLLNTLDTHTGDQPYLPMSERGQG